MSESYHRQRPADGTYGGSVAGLERAPTLPEFLEEYRRQYGNRLEIDRGLAIVDQALHLFEDCYTHLHFKRALYGIDPVRRLELLRYRLLHLAAERRTGDPLPTVLTTLDFHREMSDIFISVRDRHMNYYWPEPFASYWAFLGCEIERAWDPGPAGLAPVYLLSRVHPELRDEAAGFVEGAEVLFWNALPIERTVQLSAQRNPGSNEDARLAMGLARLTLRPLGRVSPPDEAWVDLRLRHPESGAETSKRLEWRILDYPPKLRCATADRRGGVELGIDPEGESSGRLRALLRGAASEASGARSLFAAEELPAAADGPFRFAYLRLFSFDSIHAREVLEEVRGRIHRLPQSGLVIDLRDNPGGSIALAESLLQELTAGEVEVERFQFPASELTYRLTTLGAAAPQRVRSWQRWGEGFLDSLATGDRHSKALPITTTRPQREPRIFYGPIVLIFNARSYSAADIFAAGFQDNHLGVLLGTDRTTGAGGANVVEHGELVEIVERAAGGEAGAGGPRFSVDAPPSLPAVASGRPPGAAYDLGPDALKSLGIAALPDSTESPQVQRHIEGPVGMSVAIRRSLRVGDNAGRPLEDLGVEADRLHSLTRRDVLEGNPDLKQKAAGLLLASPHLLAARWGPCTPTQWTVEIQARGIDDYQLSLLEGPLGATETLPFTDGRLGREVHFTREPVAGGRRTRADGVGSLRLVLHNLPARRGFSGLLIRGLANRGESLEVVAGWVLLVEESKGEGALPRRADPGRRRPATPERRPGTITPSR